jgi:hypothetical protein
MPDQFWKPEPKAPWRDWRTWGMFVPLLASMLGFAFTGLFAFAFSDIGVIRAEVQSWMVIVGSALIVWGAEANTPFTVIEVFRKILRKEHNGWDISALAASLTGTAINVLVTFASRQVLFGDSLWRQLALSWGPLISGVAVTLDYYGGMIELGFLFGSHEARSDQWRLEREQWRRANGQSVVGEQADLVGQLDNLTEQVGQLVERWAWPVATSADVKRATAELNGDRANLTREEVGLILAEHHLNLPSDSTIRRGLGG